MKKGTQRRYLDAFGQCLAKALLDLEAPSPAATYRCAFQRSSNCSRYSTWIAAHSRAGDRRAVQTRRPGRARRNRRDLASRQNQTRKVFPSPSLAAPAKESVKELLVPRDVIPGRPERPRPRDPRTPAFPICLQSGVHQFRVRGLRPRPGMTGFGSLERVRRPPKGLGRRRPPDGESPVGGADRRPRRGRGGLRRGARRRRPFRRHHPQYPGAPPTRAAPSLVRALRDARGALLFATGTSLNQCRRRGPFCMPIRGPDRAPFDRRVCGDFDASTQLIRPRHSLPAADAGLARDPQSRGGRRGSINAADGNNRRKRVDRARG